MIVTDYKSAFYKLVAVVCERPSILRNTAWVWGLRISMWFMALFSFLFGMLMFVVLLMGAWMDHFNTLFEITVVKVDKKALIQGFGLLIAAICFLLTILSLLMAFLCRVILRRNSYMRKVDAALVELDEQLQMVMGAAE